MGASLSDRYLSQQRGTAKIMTEHDRLRRELLQVCPTVLPLCKPRARVNVTLQLFPPMLQEIELM